MIHLSWWAHNYSAIWGFAMGTTPACANPDRQWAKLLEADDG